MMRAALAEARVFDSWRNCQDALIRALAPLTSEQLQYRVLPGRRTPGEVARHIVFGRALHLHRALGAAAAPVEPFLRWDDASAPTPPAEEIVRGLEVTWRVIVGRLMAGSPTDDIASGDETSAQVIWGLLDHDLPHAGQLSILLRASGLAGVEL